MFKGGCDVRLSGLEIFYLLFLVNLDNDFVDALAQNQTIVGRSGKVCLWWNI